MVINSFYKGRREGSNQHSEEVLSLAVKKMTRSEAGKRGGQTTMRKYGSEFYQKIGQAGGRKGGQTTKQRYGSEFYQKIGRLGGLK